jgi:hypothetical protein
MGKATRRSRGFTLIASLLMLALLSGIALGLMYLVNGSARMGGNDLESNMAYYGAEAGMEKLTTDVLTLYRQKMAPSQSDFNTLASTSGPSSALVGGMTYNETVTLGSTTGTTTLTTGPYAGLIAETVPITLQVSAIRPSGATVNMTRGVEVALIPVFQFGVFSDSDLSYFAGPQFGFQGRVHTNGNLFLAADSGPLILDAKVTAVGQIIRDRLANNFSNGSNYQGSVFVPNQSGGCDAFLAGGSQGSNCLDFGPDTGNGTNDASWSGGIPTAGSVNSNWASGTYISTTTFGGMIGNAASTGVKTLTLPFVTGATTATQQIQIIRKPASTTESPTSQVGSSREYTKSTIRVLLGDTEAELHPTGTANDSNDVQLETLTSGFSVTGTGTSYFAVADKTNSLDPNLTVPRCPPGSNAAAPYPTYPESTGCGTWSSPPTKWPLIRGWLRVEYIDKTSGNPVGITTQWLGYGFAKSGLIARTAPGADTSGHPNAILIFQQLADRNGDGTISGSGTNTAVTSGGVAMGFENSSMTASGTNAGINFYPINFYDPREGFPRDTTTLTGTQCYANGIMNAVELDLGNLQQWLKGNGAYTSGNGKNVNFVNQNGYLLFFSDRRGMEPDPNATPTANVTTGESGIEDVVNWSSATGTPDGLLETKGNSGSAEDVDQNNLLDNWGEVNIGDGFGANTNGATPNPYGVVDCWNGGRQNWVSGARHVLKLVDGGLGNLPVRLDNNGGGFTVASENPVYVQGNYNTDNTDGFWGNTAAADPGNHAAAAIIADAVTLLSNGWSDLNSMAHPLNLGNRNATETYYRMAIAGGKNLNFLQPTVGNPPNDFGTDGGVHNFLRYIENWGTTLHYRGSIVSLYYAQYATGIYKCCNLVYSPPTRDYYFDKDFLTPTQLPPGTPMLQDIENLSYWQNFNPCSAQSGGACTN